MSDNPPAIDPLPAPASRSVPWLHWVVLAAAAGTAMLCGAGAATLVTLLVMRGDDQPQTAQRYEVRVILDMDATAAQKAAVESMLSSRYPGGPIRLESRPEAYERFKDVFKDRPDLLRDIRPEAMAESLLAVTTTKGFDCAALSPVEGVDGVDAVHVRRLADAGHPDAVLLDCP